jgi:rubrerythrin
MNETIQNLAKAFIGESQARNRYTFYAKTAKKEGYGQISSIFLETAEQEKEHAKWLFRLINQLNKDPKVDELTVDGVVPTTLGTTIENLKAAIAGEHYEYVTMYPEFANVAEKEGYTKIAARLRAIANCYKKWKIRQFSKRKPKYHGFAVNVATSMKEKLHQISAQHVVIHLVITI